MDWNQRTSWWSNQSSVPCLEVKTDTKVWNLALDVYYETPWTVAHQTPLTMESSRQEYWSRYLISSPGDLPNTGIKSRFPTLKVDSLPSEPPGKPFEKLFYESVFKPLVTWNQLRWEYLHHHGNQQMTNHVLFLRVSLPAYHYLCHKMYLYIMLWWLLSFERQILCNNFI